MTKFKNYEINERIKFLRTHYIKDENDRMFSQADFSKQLDLPKNTIGALENLRTYVSEECINNICSKFNISKEWIVNGTGNILNDNPNKTPKTKLNTVEFSTANSDKRTAVVLNSRAVDNKIPARPSDEDTKISTDKPSTNKSQGCRLAFAPRTTNKIEFTYNSFYPVEIKEVANGIYELSHTTVEIPIKSNHYTEIKLGIDIKLPQGYFLEIIPHPTLYIKGSRFITEDVEDLKVKVASLQDIVITNEVLFTFKLQQIDNSIETVINNQNKSRDEYLEPLINYHKKFLARDGDFIETTFATQGYNFLFGRLNQLLNKLIKAYQTNSEAFLYKLSFDAYVEVIIMFSLAIKENDETLQPLTFKGICRYLLNDVIPNNNEIDFQTFLYDLEVLVIDLEDNNLKVTTVERFIRKHSQLINYMDDIRI